MPVITWPPTVPAPISCHTVLAPALPLPWVASSAWRETGGRSAPCSAGLGVASQGWVVDAGAPQNGRSGSVISRFILLATAKRLLVLLGLSTTLAARKAHMPPQPSSFSFSAL